MRKILQVEGLEDRYLLSAPPSGQPPAITGVYNPQGLQSLYIGTPSGVFDAATRTFNLNVLVQGSGPIGSQGQVNVKVIITNLTFIGKSQSVGGIANVSGHGATVVTGTLNLNSLPMGIYSIVIEASDNSGQNPKVPSSGPILLTIPPPKQQSGIIAMNLNSASIA